ncbi:MAG: hypothetical protein IT561_20585 [Alphaproteobacteria bacterium]|nr:hypothetical protein [Alphaproteobacteria bacterium]
MSAAIDDRETTARVMRVVPEEPDRPLDTIMPTSRPESDLGIDSLDFVKLIAAIEHAITRP